MKDLNQDQIGAYSYSTETDAVSGECSVYVQDLNKPHDVPENQWEGRLIWEGLFDKQEEAFSYLRERIVLDLHAQVQAGLKLLE
jgi:hypothetical protein